MNEREIFSRALKKSDPEERSAFLDEVCGQETPQRHRIEQLLNELPNLSDYLEHPAIEAVATELVTGGVEERQSAGTDTLPDMETHNLAFLDPSDNPDALGTLGQYEIMEIIGRGGMGIVLRGIDPKLNRVVAIKVLSPDFAANPTAHKRFLREAQAAAAVSHDHIVTIHAVEENPIPHLVMEFIDGKSLQQKIHEEGQLELKEVLRIARQIAAGLAAAHEQGLTHRDIKPSNILLKNGIQRVQITDFGLARATADADITRTGEIAGTPQYMSPEQAKSEPVDPRSDLFSLGSVMYAMCCGHSPFRAETPYGSIKRVCEDEPRSIRENNPEIPTWLEEIIFKLLEKNPDDRFQSAEEVVELLGKHLSHLQDPGVTAFPGLLPPVKKTPPSRRSSTRRHAVATVAVVLLALLTLGFTEAVGVTHMTSTVIRIMTGEGMLVVEVDDPSVEVSIDGESLSITGAGLQEVKLRPGQYQFTATKDGQPVEQKLVSISRGGREVVRVSRENVMDKTPGGFVSPAGDYRCIPEGVIRLERVFPRPNKVHRGWSCVRELSFFPKGSQLACDGLLLELWDLRTGNAQFLDHTDQRNPGESEPNAGATYAIAISADGKLIAAANREGNVRIWDVERREVVQTIDARVKHIIGGLAFSHNGNYLICCDNLSGNARLFELESGNEKWSIEAGHPSLAEFTSDDQVVMFQDGSSLKFIDVATGTGRTVATKTRSLIMSAALSPDNKVAVVGAMTGMISMVDVETGTVLHRTSAHQDIVHSIAFLPDGRHFVSGSEDMTMRLWNSETGLEIARIEGVSHFTNEIAVSPDGRFVVSGGGQYVSPEGEYLTDTDHNIRLWRLPESVWPVTSAAVETSPFVVLRGNGQEVAKFSSLEEAVFGSSAGDSIEIHGNGPFVVRPLKLPYQHPLSIRAGEGFHPVILANSAIRLGREVPLLDARSSLALEGLELRADPSTPCRLDARLVTAHEELSMVNCRLVMGCAGYCVDSLDGSGDVDIRNCELLISDSRNGVIHIAALGRQINIANSLLIGTLVLDIQGDVEDSALTLTHNSIAGHGIIGLEIDRTIIDSAVAQQMIPLKVNLSDNVALTGTSLAVRVHQHGEDITEFDGLEELLSSVLTWKEQRNLYEIRHGFLIMFGNWTPEREFPQQLRIAELEDWNRLWGIGETGSIYEPVHFQGGVIPDQDTAKLITLNPNDFRLRPDSAGYQAGPNGKDLGADIDFVGPGEAYERWKKTEDYHQWLQDARQLLQPESPQTSSADTSSGSKTTAD